MAHLIRHHVGCTPARVTFDDDEKDENDNDDNNEDDNANDNGDGNVDGQCMEGDCNKKNNLRKNER